MTDLDSAPSLLFARDLPDVGWTRTLTVSPTSVQLEPGGLQVPGEPANTIVALPALVRLQ